MGKGDKKTKRGKIFKGSYGNSRRRKDVSDNAQAEVAVQEVKPKSKEKAKK